MIFLACVDVDNCLDSGEAVLNKYGFKSKHIYTDLTVLLVFSFSANVLGYVGLLRRTKKRPAYWIFFQTLLGNSCKIFHILLYIFFYISWLNLFQYGNIPNKLLLSILRAMYKSCCALPVTATNNLIETKDSICYIISGVCLYKGPIKYVDKNFLFYLDICQCITLTVYYVDIIFQW